MITDVTLKVPEAMRDIVAETSQALYVEAIKEVTSKRIMSIQQRLDELHNQIARYAKKYQQSYEEFSRNVPDTIEGHEDWMDWKYLVDVTVELSGKLQKFKLLLGQ